MGVIMHKKWFWIGLIIIYLLFLSKDTILGYFRDVKIDEFLESAKIKYYEEEYEELSTLLDIPLYDYDYLYSKVLLRDIYAFFDEITISGGYSDGIKVGNLVVDDKGVIGTVSKTYKKTSRVLLLTSEDTKLSVKINDNYGILESSNHALFVTNLKLNDDIKVGDKVYTSGLTKTPSNVLIGTVKSILKDNLGLELKLLITPASNYQKIPYVGILREVES